MRCFLAILPPPEVIEHLDDFLQARRDADASGDRQWRWTRQEHLHLTLAFLAELPDWRIDGLIAGLDDWAQRHTPVSLRAAGGGAFPEPGRAKVLWLGIAPDVAAGEIATWAGQLRALATHHGGDVDGQRFVPHLTAARSGRAHTAGRWLQALDSYQGPEFAVQEIALVESHLGQGPGRSPRYEVHHRATLSTR